MSETDCSLNARKAKEEEIELRRTEAHSGGRPKFLSAWDALRPSVDERYDVEFPRVQWVSREMDFD